MAIGSHRQHSHCVPSPAEGSFYAPDSNSSGRLLLGKGLGGVKSDTRVCRGRWWWWKAVSRQEREREEKKKSKPREIN